MEELIKQISIRIFHTEEENKAQTSRVVKDRKISSRRTRSSKEDGWKNKNKGGHDNRKMDSDEFRTAVAAAAFAINSKRHKEQKVKQDLNSNAKKPSSEIIEVSPKPKANVDLPSELGQPKPTVANSITDEKVSVNTISPAPHVEKTPNFVINKKSGENSSKIEPESRLEEPDIWEKTEMEKIKQRFMKVKATIFEWESKKKSKAKNKLTRKEGKLEWKRARTLQDFKKKMEAIEEISKSARARNEERRKNEEIRVKEKAKMIRSTGKFQKPMFLCC